MLSYASAFIANAFLRQFPTKDLRQNSFAPLTSIHGYASTGPRLSKSWRPHLAPNMRKHQNHGFSSHQTVLKSLEKLQKSATSVWQNASPSERLLIGSAGIAAVMVASIAINVLFHISLMLAFSFVPLLIAPILFTFVASLTTFAFMVFATAGAGVFFISTPFFAFTLIAKALLPIVLIFGGTWLVVSRLLGFRSSEPVESFEPIEEIDDFERFDRTLRNRQTPKGDDVARWDISDVIDELEYRGLGGYRQLFIEERIDGPALLELTYEDIRTEFGTSMPLGDRMRLIRLVSVLRRQSSSLP